MNKKLANATRVVSQPAGPFRANGVNAQNQEASSTVLDQDLLSTFRLPGSSEQQAQEDYAYALAALQAAMGERTGIPHNDLMGWCCEEHVNVPDDFKSLTGEAMRMFARNGPAFDVLWKVKVSKGTTLEALPDEKTAMRQSLQAIDELIAINKLTPDTAHDWKSVARRAHDRHDTLLNTRLGANEPSDALAWMTLAHAGHQLSGAEGDAPARLRAASVAWRNGFTKSGTGTDFNRAVHRMHKVATWINRAEQPSNGPRFVQRAFGKQLSPLLAMKPGLLGGDLGDIATETSRLAGHTRAAVERLRTALDETIRAATYAQLDARSQSMLQLKKAVLDHWESLGDNLPDGAAMSTRRALAFIEQMPQSPSSRDALTAEACRILETGFSLNVLERWAASPEVSAHINTVELLKDTGKAREAANPLRCAPAENETREEFLAVARAAVKTEGVQFRHGGDVGLEPMISAPFVMGAPGFSGVGGSLRGTKGRSATMRIGTSTIGSDIFIGTEKRLSRGGSVFAFAGASPVSSVKLGVAGRLAYRYEEGSETGVSLRVSKNVADHQAQCLEVIEFLFNKAADTDNGSNDAPGLWERFANRFFDSNVSVNFVEGESASHHATLAANAGGGWVNENHSIGAHLRADIERRTSQTRRIETTGHANSNTAIDRVAISAPIQARIGWNPIPSITPHGPTQIDNVGTVPMPLLAYRAEFTVPSGSAGQIRLTMEDDRIQPSLSLQQREFSGQDHFIGHLQERREEWEAALGGVGNFDAVMADIRSLNMAPHQAAGNFRYTERLRLTTQAADSLTLLHAQRKLCQGDDNAAGRKLALDAAFEARLHDAKSWEPEKLAVFEVAKMDKTFGPDYLMVAKTFVQTTSVTRYLYQAKATPAAEPATAADATAHRDSQLHSQSEAFRDALGVLYGGRDVEYLGSLHRALIRALPASEGPTPFADALEVAQAMRQLEWPTTLESIQVLASIMSGQPGGTARINRLVQELRATLAQSEPGRAALARLPAP